MNCVVSGLHVLIENYIYKQANIRWGSTYAVLVLIPWHTFTKGFEISYKIPDIIYNGEFKGFLPYF